MHGELFWDTFPWHRKSSCPGEPGFGLSLKETDFFKLKNFNVPKALLLLHLADFLQRIDFLNFRSLEISSCI